MKTIRRIVQILLFVLFLFIFFMTIYPLPFKEPGLFMKLSPLNSLTLLLSGRGMAGMGIGLVVLILTVFLGRFFCGWVCPMGSTVDIGEKICGGGTNQDKKNYSHIKYFILILFLTSTLFQFPLAYLLEPMSLSYRFYTLSVFPPLYILWGWVNRIYTPSSDIVLSHTSVVFRTGIPLFLFMLGIVLLGRYYRRFWCRNLCPLGGLFAIVGRFSFINKKVSDKCVNCGKCVRECKMSAIPSDPKDFIPQECIYCGNCVSLCPTKAISFSWGMPYKIKDMPDRIKSFFTRKAKKDQGFTRRNLFESLGLGIVMAGLGKSDYNKKYPHPRLIRPPASQPEEQFNMSCIRCGQCMKVCITGGLQPTLTESGLAGFMTPRLIPQAGYCEQNCNLCSQVCPTGAIQKFENQDKPHIRMGLANIDRSKCLVWFREEACLVCDEHCSYKAIYWKWEENPTGNQKGEPGTGEKQAVLKPYVNKERCVGCGICENKCPVKPQAAIQVYSQGETRIIKPPHQNWQELNPIPEETESDRHQIQPHLQDGNPNPYPYP